MVVHIVRHDDRTAVHRIAPNCESGDVWGHGGTTVHRLGHRHRGRRAVARSDTFIEPPIDGRDVAVVLALPVQRALDAREHRHQGGLEQLQGGGRAGRQTAATHQPRQDVQDVLDRFALRLGFGAARFTYIEKDGRSGSALFDGGLQLADRILRHQRKVCLLTGYRLNDRVHVLLQALQPMFLPVPRCRNLRQHRNGFPQLWFRSFVGSTGLLLIDYQDIPEHLEPIGPFELADRLHVARQPVHERGHLLVDLLLVLLIILVVLLRLIALDGGEQLFHPLERALQRRHLRLQMPDDLHSHSRRHPRRSARFRGDGLCLQDRHHLALAPEPQPVEPTLYRGHVAVKQRIVVDGVAKTGLAGGRRVQQRVPYLIRLVVEIFHHGHS
uniref:Uncharacterized protein n=1 Tax=Anopheles atroparvus TaxID=41427 RepID=A0A182IVJ5_ANOAO